MDMYSENGCSIGSLGWDLQEAGVQNVTVKSVTLRGTQNGLRVKTWARRSNGFVKGILFQNAVMVNVRNPIIIDQNYCPSKNDCPNQVGVVKQEVCTYIYTTVSLDGTQSSIVIVCHLDE